MDSLKQDFLKVIDKHQGIIKSLCHIYYHDFEDQRDTRQDIILQLWKSFTSFRGESNISTWIYKVSLNTILSKIKKEKRRPRNESLSHLHENKPVPSLNADDDLQFLNQLIQSLKELDKAVIILYLEGYKNNEIAQLIGLTPSNIGTRMNRIKATLKSKFRIYHYDFK
ncbi:sigma-70 family RNA polymerase sigma factor [Fulvivirgaceae bacterium BMA10]|uniref:Sigma-70 family RNA polymerase sigma factor n=1 Tax=Splendidivirga corallicola TaxID=3051826 RepID=A0ABT8KVW1_9BACT|nr:sigma-70 family RNA polymerase sigma factor [Fulvivirgaceae bacterium BMA10]